MATKKNFISQLSNFESYLMYRDEFLTLAENVFIFENLPVNVDLSFINKELVRKGSIAFFNDEVLGLLALPYVNLSKLDLYGRPVKIQVMGKNGYRKVLNNGEFVIMFDNNSHKPLFTTILQYAERVASYQRTIDINIANQKTNRVWRVPKGQELTFKNMIQAVDSNTENIMVYDGLDITQMTAVVEPAPYVADKIEQQKNHVYNEFLRTIGIANNNYQKKERQIVDEISMMQGGTVASRYDRFNPRKVACEKIKDLLGVDLKVKYYDGLPSSIDSFEEKEEMGAVENGEIAKEQY